MASIDNLKTLLKFNISDGRYKMPVYINENNKSVKNAIFIFYTNENETLALATTVDRGYFSNSIQVVCRHNDYNKARTVAYAALKYIGSRKKTFTGLFIRPESPPVYTGIDELTSGYTWSFELTLKGAE
jgi:hypothetical protein